MASVAEHKRRIQMKRGLQQDPYGFLSTYFGQSAGGLEDRIIDAAIQAMIGQLEDLMRDPSFIAAIAQNLDVPSPENGRDGAQGPRGFKGDKGDKGDKGEPGQIGPMGIRGQDGENGKDGTEIEGKDIVHKINDLPLEPDQQIHASHIKGLPDMVKDSVPLHRGGVKLVWNVELDGTIDGVNTTFTIPGNQPEPKDGRLVISARGVLKDTDSGDFTISGRTVTFTDAPPSGSSRPRAVIYHGK